MYPKCATAFGMGCFKRVILQKFYGLTQGQMIHTQKCEPCQLNKPTTPFPAGGFPPDTASSTRPKAQAWPQFNRHVLDIFLMITNQGLEGSFPKIRNLCDVAAIIIIIVVIVIVRHVYEILNVLLPLGWGVSNESSYRNFWRAYSRPNDTYSRPNDIRATATTSRSSRLNGLRQNDSLWRTRPYEIIWIPEIKTTVKYKIWTWIESNQ